MEEIPAWLGAILLALGAIALSSGAVALLAELPGLGGDHLRTCTASRGCSTACRVHRTSSMPSTTCIATRDDTTSTDRTPSAALAESIVCADSWMHVPSHSLMGATGSKVWGSESFMGTSVLSRARTVCNDEQEQSQ
ncbi:hypothetical protein D3C71_1746460 [compost metagenome]